MPGVISNIICPRCHRIGGAISRRRAGRIVKRLGKRRFFWYIGHYTPNGKRWCSIGSDWGADLPPLSQIVIPHSKYTSDYRRLLETYARLYARKSQAETNAFFEKHGKPRPHPQVEFNSKDEEMLANLGKELCKILIESGFPKRWAPAKLDADHFAHKYAKKD